MKTKDKTIKRIHRVITGICLIVALVLSYSLILGRGRVIPEKIDYTTVKKIILTQGDKTRVLHTRDIHELQILLETLETMELKPGLAPIFPDEEVAVMEIWYSRGKYMNQYIFMEGSVMRSQGLMVPHHYILIDDKGMYRLISHILDEEPVSRSGKWPEE